MKQMVTKNGTKKIVVPTGQFHQSDWFKCEKCGYMIMKKVLGNTATCPECGGRMNRV